MTDISRRFYWKSFCYTLVKDRFIGHHLEYTIVTRLREAHNKLPAQQTESEDAAHEELRKKIEIQRLLRGFQRECPRQQTLSAGSGQVFLLLKRKRCAQL